MSDDSLNPLLILGMVALIAGAVALVYGHMELLEAQQDSGFFAMGGGAGYQRHHPQYQQGVQAVVAHCIRTQLVSVR